MTNTNDKNPAVEPAVHYGASQNSNPGKGYYEVEVPKEDESVVSPDLPAQTGPQEIQEIINLINNQGNLVAPHVDGDILPETKENVEVAEELKSPTQAVDPNRGVAPTGQIALTDQIGQEIEESLSPDTIETGTSAEGLGAEELKNERTEELRNEETEVISASKFLIIKDIVENIKNELSRITELLSGSVPQNELEELSKKLTVSKTAKEEASGLKIIEGVFDGDGMVGEDGNKYPVPPNYASKSKLVEGDLLKLTIKQDGSFVYKQIAPIERKRVVGILAYDEGADQHYVLGEGKKWKIIRASVTYFKGEPGDEVTIVVPRDAPSQWAAVENILKK